MATYRVLLLLAFTLLHDFIDGNEDAIVMMKIERQALGNIPVLGQLYSAHSDQLLHGFSFWYEDEVEANKIKTWHPWQETHILRKHSQDVDLNLLRVDAQLEASFKAGMVTIAGSADYLNRDQTNDKSSSVTFTYQSRSRTESISPSLTQNTTIDVCSPDNPVNRLNENYQPTHVVSAITYGGDVHFVYTEETNNFEDIMDIYGALSIKIDLKATKISGKASVNYTTDEKDFNDHLKIEMYSDFIIDKQPTSFNDTIKIYETVAQNFGSKEKMYELSVPMSMELIPIIAFCPLGDSASEIAASILKVATNIRITLKGVEKKVDKLLDSTAAEKNFRVKELLLDFQLELSKYTLNYESKLKKLIVDARNPKSQLNESALDELINEYKSSDFNYDKFLYGYLTERTRQVNAINMFYEQTVNQNEPQIADYSKADIPRAILTRPVLFLLTLNILPNVDQEKYNSYINTGGENTKNVWYNDKIKVGQIGQLWRDFLGFFSFNDYKVGFGFFVETIEEKIDSGASGVMDINLYDNGGELEITKEQFAKLVQTGPEIEVQRNLDSNNLDTMQVKVAVPNDNTDDKPFKITKVVVKIVQSTPDSSNLFPNKIEIIENSLDDVCVDAECRINIKSMQPEYSYNISVSYNSKYGSGKSSEVIKSNGIFDEMMKTAGCVIDNNIKLNNLVKKEASTIYDCAEYNRGFWSYDIGSKKCYSAIPDKETTSPTIGWATGTGSCSGVGKAVDPPPPVVTTTTKKTTTEKTTTATTIPTTTTPPDIIGCLNPDSASIKWDDYRGKQDVTANGHPCKNWMSQDDTAKWPTEYPGKGIGDHNYCRNANLGAPSAYCLVADPDIRWGVCDIPMCGPIGCLNPDSVSNKYDDYRGRQNETVSGYTCQDWSVQSPQEHVYTLEEYPGKGLEDGNFCRNPTQSTDKPYCFTINPDKRWEECNIPMCPELSQGQPR